MVFILKQNDIGKFVITDILYFFILFFSNFLNFYTPSILNLTGLNMSLTKIQNSRVLQNLSLIYIL